MKIRICMKDPDGPYDCIREAVKESMSNMEFLTDHEREAFYTARLETVEDACRPWLRYGEYMDIEIDTDTNSAVVIKHE